jgi:hypothetical protein
VIAVSVFFQPAFASDVIWTPDSVKQTILQGTATLTTVKFTSRTARQDVDVELERNLKHVITVIPSHFDTLEPGVTYSLSLITSISDQPRGTEYTGELRLRSRCHERRETTLTGPGDDLYIDLQVAHLSSTEIPDGIVFPSTVTV